MSELSQQDSIAFQVKNENFLLLAEKCIYWENEKALLIADVHFSKAAHFRKSGINLHQAIHLDDLEKIDALIKKYGAKQIYFLGDLLHSDPNSEWQILKDWIDKNELKISLILGNHEFLNEKVYRDLGLEIIAHQKIIRSIILQHEPIEKNGSSKETLNICGHIHPAVTLKAKGKVKFTVAAFILKKNQLIMPAFGKLTGLHVLKKEKTMSVFICVGGKILELN